MQIRAPPGLCHLAMMLVRRVPQLRWQKQKRRPAWSSGGAVLPFVFVASTDDVSSRAAHSCADFSSLCHPCGMVNVMDGPWPAPPYG